MTRTLINAEVVDNLSTVTIGTELGQFTATVLCQPADMPYMSQFFGCELAELKATLKYFRLKKQLTKARIDALVNFYSTMRSTRTFDPKSFYVKKLMEEIKSLEKVYADCDASIKGLQKAYKAKIDARDKFNQTQRTKTGNTI